VVGPAPVVQQVTGAFAHKGAVTIAGLGFGTKAQAAPLVWDDASGTNVLDKWSGYWPTTAPTSSSNMQYMAPIRGVNPPHNRVGTYLTGAHEGCTDANSGVNVAVWKDFNKVEGGYLYLSYYSFVDTGWVFNVGASPNDGNFKTFGYSVQGSIYELPNNWYESLWDSQGRGLWSATFTSYTTIINDDSGIMFGNGPQYYGGHTINPIGSWVKREVLVKISATANGAITITENNGSPCVTYTGITDPYAGTGRSAGPGGFVRDCGSVNNRRYFADLYMDTTPARVMLIQGKLIEPQLVAAWSDTSITFTVNLGAAVPGAANLVVFNSSGVQVGSFAVTI
jgi:hypothetical protein